MRLKVITVQQYIITVIVYIFIFSTSNVVAQTTTSSMQVRAAVIQPMPVNVSIYNSQTDTLNYKPTITIPIENTPYSIQLTETKWNTSSYYIDRNNKHETCSISICYL